MEKIVKYEWLPEGDGYTLFRSTPISTVHYNCGRLNTNATGSTSTLAALYNAAPDLLAACKLLVGCQDYAMNRDDGLAVPSYELRAAITEAQTAIAKAEKGTQ